MGILRKLFGPSQEEIWRKIAGNIGGDFTRGGFWKTDAIRFAHGEWEILLDTYAVSTGQTTVTYTRMRAPFVNKDGFYFKIYRESVFSPMGKMFGMQDIEIGDALFDNAFVIKSNNRDKIQRLLNADLRFIFEKQPKISIEIKDDEGRFGKTFPDGVDELYFTCGGIMKDVQALYNLFGLFAAILNRLVAIDSAYEDDPGISL